LAVGCGGPIRRKKSPCGILYLPALAGPRPSEKPGIVDHQPIGVER